MLADLLLLANAASGAIVPAAANFNEVLTHASSIDVAEASLNNVRNWDDYYDYVSTNVELLSRSDDDYANSEGIFIIDLADELNYKYPNYAWERIDDECSITSNVSNHIPINVKIDAYLTAEINQAIVLAGVQDKTNYGGCGPIAAIGMLDYFARYLGYDEIIDDPTDSAKRVALAAEVMSNTNYSVTGSVDNSRVWPWDMVNGFNAVILDRDLSIQAEYKVSLFGGRGSEFWNDIVENIDRGLPVTIFTSDACGPGEFSNHYSNIYGYETWKGTSNDGENTIRKTFLKGRLNLERYTSEYYCDSNILNYIHSGIITYDPHYEESYTFTASDFAEEFVNDSGGGQYFFSPMSDQVALSNGRILQTIRLRTSYIENEFLVLSPNRENAGTAYLDITFPAKVSQLSFDAFLWSRYEGISGEELKMQYYDDGWYDHITIDLGSMPVKYDQNCTRFALFPKDTTRIRFYATHQSPSGSRNKGRICLDNFEVSYNDGLWEA